MGQESGHQWLAFVQFDNNGVPSSALLGRDNAHWSFFLDTDASDMEGNNWMDHGNGTFTTTDATSRFSSLDQYIMGLRPPEEVPDFFLITNPVPANPCPGFPSPPFGFASCPPAIGVTVSGTRRNISINQIVAVEGVRDPVMGFSAVNPTTVHRQAFILLVRPGTTPSQADIDKWERIRAAWIPYFAEATDGRGSIDTALSLCPHDGNVNQLGGVTPSDALLAFQHFLEIAEPSLTTCQQRRANVVAPETSGVTPADALCIFQKALGQQSCLD
jgi:hypothetical protein